MDQRRHTIDATRPDIGAEVKKCFEDQRIGGVARSTIQAIAHSMAMCSSDIGVRASFEK